MNSKNRKAKILTVNKSQMTHHETRSRRSNSRSKNLRSNLTLVTKSLLKIKMQPNLNSSNLLKKIRTCKMNSDKSNQTTMSRLRNWPCRLKRLRLYLTQKDQSLSQQRPSSRLQGMNLKFQMLLTVSKPIKTSRILQRFWSRSKHLGRRKLQKLRMTLKSYSRSTLSC